MSRIILQWSIVPTWTPAYCSAKTAGNGATLCFCAEFKEPDMSNAMACTSQNTIRNSVGAARPMTKSTHHDLRQKKGEPCPHSFKCLNCCSDHLANSNQCSFWRHRFNREWHQKKYTEICENRSKSIRSEVNDTLCQWLLKISRFFCKTSTRTPY